MTSLQHVAVPHAYSALRNMWIYWRTDCADWKDCKDCQGKTRGPKGESLLSSLDLIPDWFSTETRKTNWIVIYIPDTMMSLCCAVVCIGGVRGKKRGTGPTANTDPSTRLGNGHATTPARLRPENLGNLGKPGSLKWTLIGRNRVPRIPNTCLQIPSQGPPKARPSARTGSLETCILQTFSR